MRFVPRLSTCAAFVALASLPAVGRAVTNSSLSSTHEVPTPTSGSSAPAREGSGRAVAMAREAKPRSRLLVLNDCPGVSSSILLAGAPPAFALRSAGASAAALAHGAAGAWHRRRRRGHGAAGAWRRRVVPRAKGAREAGGRRRGLPRRAARPKSRGVSSIVLFDGVCNFCNAGVNFIIDRDRAAHFRFAPLQSEYAKRLLAERGVDVGEGDPESMVLVEGERVSLRSTAALRIARRLAGPWRLAFAFVAVPAFARDGVYRLVARQRYRLFGRSDACRVPTPEVRARFLA